MPTATLLPISGATETAGDDQANEVEVNDQTWKTWDEFRAINPGEYRFFHQEHEHVVLVVDGVHEDHDSAFEDVEAFLLQMGGRQSDKFVNVPISRELYEEFDELLGDLHSVKGAIKGMMRRIWLVSRSVDIALESRERRDLLKSSGRNGSSRN